MESLEDHFNFADYFQPHLHSLALFFSNISRCNRFSMICIMQNSKLKDAWAWLGLGFDSFDLVGSVSRFPFCDWCVTCRGRPAQGQFCVDVSVDVPNPLFPEVAVHVSRTRSKIKTSSLSALLVCAQVRDTSVGDATEAGFCLSLSRHKLFV